MGFWGKVSLGLVAGVLCAGLGLGAIVWINGSRSVPALSGELPLPGLSAPAIVVSDDRGIPTIRAENMRDAYRVLGFLHARDRLWQMEMMRRVGAGRLSEILGSGTVQIDRTMRELGLRDQAMGQEAILTDDQRADFQAYSDGVNQYLGREDTILPIEFQLTLHDPEPWQISDSLYWGRLMSLQLSENGFQEAYRDSLTELLGADRAADLLPRNDGSPTTMNAANRPSWLESYDASNAWVLSGERTETGAPILANDPHLGIGMPGQWYLVRIETPELTLVGVTAPGVPLHILGHNGRIAWGMTTTHADNQDTILLTPAQLAAAETIEETIRVRFGDDIPLQRRETSFGPILTSLGSPGRALRWTGSDTAQRTPQALYQLNRAESWQDFLAAIALFDDPVQNVFYADRDGTIGMKLAGEIPIRRTGDAGILPIAAGGTDDPWTGIVASSELPGLVNPATGMILNANNRIIDASYPHSISHGFKDSYRIERLIEAMAPVSEGHRLLDSAALQTDTLSVAARELIPHLVTAEPSSPLAARALDILSDWDFHMRRDAAAPAIYSVYVNELVRVLIEDDLDPALLRSAWRNNPTFVRRVLSEKTDWCDNVLTEPREDCARALAVALDRAILVLTKALGDDPADWRWGALHTAPMTHRLLNRIPGLGSLGNRPMETDGADDTLNRGQSVSGEAAPFFDHLHGASFRAIYDLSDLDNSLFALAGGQSGNPFSPFYGSLLDDWRDGRYFRIPGRGEDIAEPGSRLLRLHP